MGLVPADALRLLTWQELAEEVCGASEVDIDILQKNTVFGSMPEGDPAVGFLFRALREFTNDERKLFLKFVMGRSRLPASGVMDLKFKISLFRTCTPNEALPQSHSCLVRSIFQPTRCT